MNPYRYLLSIYLLIAVVLAQQAAYIDPTKASLSKRAVDSGAFDPVTLDKVKTIITTVALLGPVGAAALATEVTGLRKLIVDDVLRSATQLAHCLQQVSSSLTPLLVELKALDIHAC